MSEMMKALKEELKKAEEVRRVSILRAEAFARLLLDELDFYKRDLIPFDALKEPLRGVNETMKELEDVVERINRMKERLSLLGEERWVGRT